MKEKDLKEIYLAIKNDKQILSMLNKINDKTNYVIDHGLIHTQNVCKYIKKICKVLQLNNEKLYLSLVAGYLHDIGRIYSQEQHSKHSANFAKDYLKDKLTSEHLEIVCETIRMHEKENFDYSSTNDCAYVVILADKMDYARDRFVKKLIDKKAKSKIAYNLKKFSLTKENETIILTIEKYKKDYEIQKKYIDLLESFYKKIFKHFNKKFVLKII